MNRVVFALIAVLLLLSVSSITGLIQLAKAEGGTITINADGSISPSTAPIYTADNITYTLTGNISSPAYDGIVVERNNTVIDGNGYTLRGNDTSSVSSGPGLGLTSQGLSLTSMSNVTIKNLNIKGFQDGIYLNSTSETVISGNNLVANSVDGIYLEGSTSNTVSQNNATANGYDGIALCYSSNGNVVSSNNSTVNDDDGISISNYPPFHIQYYNVYYPGSSNNTVSGNNATANSYYGIALPGSSNNTVYGNNAIENGQDGILVGSSNIISGNNVTANENCGIYLSGSSNNTVSGNNATSNNDGIYLSDSSGNVLFDNVMEDNSVFNFGVDGYSPSQFVNWVDTSNLVNGAPVFYITDKSNLLINPENYPDIGYLALVNCANITVQDLTFAHSPEEEGILLVGTNDSRITNNTVANDDEGIWLYSASNDIISGNILTTNTHGIDLEDFSNNNTVDGNNATGNGQGIGVMDATCSNNSVSSNILSADGAGITIMGSQNIFSGNNVTANTRFGIWLENSGANNIVEDNNIIANSIGVQIYFSALNMIYHNNFVGNAVQVSFYGSAGQIWDSGYPIGGNYWSDYLTKYPNATQVDSSGEWNTPYVIDANNTDYYPLTVPIAVVPEFPSLLILPLFLIATLLAVVIYKKKTMPHERSSQAEKQKT